MYLLLATVYVAQCGLDVSNLTTVLSCAAKKHIDILIIAQAIIKPARSDNNAFAVPVAVVNTLLSHL